MEVLSTRAKCTIAVIAVAAVTWFLVSWLVLGSPLTDAIGETAGSLAALMLIVSIVGTAKATREP
ncbi:hypothetical protein [Dactylosporangium matsuzakiense]|uniref:Uncharacterized protein n=1 Tax=Dactylosporangium matsuzakiense TaxID=53360 RepID=A0A9W6KM84_9ACTN|nr:hypothetical protein [Dactylosporangium matsuzakiense]UWZ44495.1 hypothetical protein Dmats_45285 [Dactylosporangium matsuzakiense]GLL01884.1 hypothetical protein GCM10017581_036260 [Dactylosporangium matsuzakiense]